MAKGKFAVGALIGAVVGTVVGVLTAPKSGKDTRAELKTKAEKAKTDAITKADNLGKEVSKKTAEARKKAEATSKDVKAKAEDYKTRGEKAIRGAVDGAKSGLNNDK